MTPTIANTLTITVYMQLKKKVLCVDAKVNGHPTRICLDTGAEITTVSKRQAEELGLQSDPTLPEETLRAEVLKDELPLTARRPSRFY